MDPSPLLASDTVGDRVGFDSFEVETGHTGRTEENYFCR